MAPPTRRTTTNPPLRRQTRRKGTSKQDSGTVGLNQPARDGDFQFTVTKLMCGVSHVDTDLLGRDTQGQYCLVSIQTKTVGKKAGSGNTAKGKLVFDVPEGTNLTSLEPHDSLFSDGVKVNLE